MSGKSPAVLATIQKAEDEVEALKAKLTVPVEFKPDRVEIRRAGLAYVGPLANGTPAAVRQILRRLKVERITIIPEGDGTWRFEGTADLSGLLSGKQDDSGERRSLPPMFTGHLRG